MSAMLHRVAIWALAVLSLLAGLPAFAQNAGAQDYLIEMIIFRTTTLGGVAEDWTVAPTPRGFGPESARGNAAPTLVNVVGADQYKLSALDAQLRSSGVWRPLAHVAWIQTAGTWGARAGLALADLGIQVPGLSGTVYFDRGQQYGHLGFDLSWGTDPAYRIDEMRSIKYGEKQYFDHPAFGVIAIASPVRAATSQ